MLEMITQTLTQNGIGSATLALAGVGLGAFLLVLGLSNSFSGSDPVLNRMKRQGAARAIELSNMGLLRPDNADPKGLLKSLVPGDARERMEVERQLSYAGVTGPGAVRNYYLLRLTLGVLLPGGLFALVWASRAGQINLPERYDLAFATLTQLQLLQILSIAIAVGFFGPVYWLRGRVAKRRQAIKEAFPNALDLIQISVESGLGIDAAMIRVANELDQTAPEISGEMLSAQREIQAGRSRERALRDMAARTGVDEVVSFVNVVLQSIQFGTSISESLTTYAREMRIHRELQAQEKANKLPVQMSAIMASLMLPALVLMTLGPVVIRYMRQFSG